MTSTANLKVVDNRSFRALRGAELLSATRVKNDEWHCCSDNNFIVVKYSKSIVGIGYGETEYDSYQIKAILINELPITKLSFINIMEKMEWTCDEDNLWIC